jgi:hypothetical protein
MQNYNYSVHDFLNGISGFHTLYTHVLKLCNNYYM